MGKIKEGDWVLGWHADFGTYKTEPWQIAKIVVQSNGEEQATPAKNHSHGTYVRNLKHAYLEDYSIF
jgi:hypothetical protein